MSTDNITLSDKRHYELGEYVYSEHSVKEFIKKQLCPMCVKFPQNNCYKCNKIKKDAGDKLL